MTTRIKPPTEILGIWAIAAVLTLEDVEEFTLVPLLLKAVFIALTVAAARQSIAYIKARRSS
ncbi:hypothetical protein ACFYYM_00650 [Streptomyces erythrochromogenes]|uniref:hypothetical protein n=1 Tax=Streptomyces erythrochromogenes TaxID=285574 RepID=UPI003692AE93